MAEGERRGGYVMPGDQIARMADLRRSVRKARKIKRVAESEMGAAPWPKATILDYGCGPGVIAAYFARLAGRVAACDVDAQALGAARGRFAGGNVDFVLFPGNRAPFADGSFDLVICNHVYEHVADAGALFRELHRLVKPGGGVYLAAASRWQVVEPHYGLPFLSWLPRPLANLYLRLAGRREGYDVRLVGYRRLKAWLTPFRVIEYTARILDEPRRYAALDVIPRATWARRCAGFVARRWPSLLPTRIFYLHRR